MPIITRGEGGSASRRLGHLIAEPPSFYISTSATNPENKADPRQTLLIGLIGLVCIVLLAIIYCKFFYKYCNACDVGLQRSGSRLNYFRWTFTGSGGGVGGAAASEGGVIAGGGGLSFRLLKMLPSFEFHNLVCSEYSRECTICLTSFLPEDTVRLLPFCRHLYHQSCIDPWLLSQASCPLCRRCIFPVDQTCFLVQAMAAPPVRYTRDTSVVPISE